MERNALGGIKASAGFDRTSAVSIGHPLNAFIPMLVPAAGKNGVTVASNVHPSNALWPIVVSVSGNATLVKATHR